MFRVTKSRYKKKNQYCFYNSSELAKQRNAESKSKAGEVTQWIRALAAFQEDLNLVPSIHVR